MQLRERERTSMLLESASRTAETGVREHAPWLIMLLTCAAQFMVVLDVSVVNVALPSIAASLGFSAAGLQWVVNAYALTFAGFLLLGGRLADIFGRKRVFMLGLALFTAASLLGGLAINPALLVIARAAQGFGAAILAPATLTILTTSFPEGDERNRALAIWTAVSVAGGAAGNLASGLLTEYLSWRWILLVNVPAGVLVIPLAYRCLPAGHHRRTGQRLDIPGAVTATVGLASLTYGITRIETNGWNDLITVAALATGIAALTLFITIEARYAGSPLIPVGLFRMRAISTGNFVMLLAGACFIPMWYFLSLLMQNVLGYGALKTGAGFIPHTLTIMAGSLLAPQILQYMETRSLIAVSAAIAGAGFYWQSLITPDSSYLTGVLGPALVICIGLGLLITPITATVTSGVDESDAGAASGLMNATRQVGGALGLALLVAIAASDISTPAALAQDYSRAFLTITAILTVVAIAALMLPAGQQRQESRRQPGETAATPASMQRD